MKGVWRDWYPLQPSLSHLANKWQNIYRGINLASCLTLLVLFLSQTAGQSEFPYEGNYNVTEFRHMAVFKNRTSSLETIYIGAKNAVLQLQVTSDNLTLVNRDITGPRNDSINCDPTVECTDPSMMDNYNKILLVNEQDGNLIVCGSIYQGTCELRDLSNVSVVTSSYDKMFDTWVTPNSPEATTLAFLVPKPGVSLGKAIIVGTTYSGSRTSDPFLYVNSIATRLLADNDIFKLTKVPSSRVQVKDLDHYKIHYRAGFTYDNYIYIVTNQKLNLRSTKNVSKIIRLCANDTDYSSLIDTELGCDYTERTTGMTYRYGLVIAANIVRLATGDMLVASFTSGTDPEELDPKGSTVVCMFSMSDVGNRLRENLGGCYNGTNEVAAQDYYWEHGGTVNQKSCQNKNNLSIPVPANGCNPVPGYKGVLGLYPLINKNPAYVMENENRTVTAIQSVTVQSQTNQTVIFLGTSDGFLFKTYVKSGELIKYESVPIDEGNAISSDLFLSSDKTKLYVMTSNKVKMIPVQNCTDVSGYKNCTKTDDPFCGWCVLEQKCSLWEQCRFRYMHNHWLPAIDKNRTLSVSVDPTSVNIQDGQQLITLSVSSLPETLPGESYDCVFTYKEDPETTPAELVSNQPAIFTCLTPENTPDLKTKYFSIVQLGLKSNKMSVGAGKHFISTELYFANCTNGETCRHCMQDELSCVWCLYGVGCTYNHTKCLPAPSDYQHFVPSRQYAATKLDPPVNSSGPGMCPQLQKTSVSSIPNNVSTEIVVTGKNLQPPHNNLRYTCQLDVSGSLQEASGTYMSNTTILCGNRQYTYSSPGHAGDGELVTTFGVKWNNRLVDNKFPGVSIKVTLYKCEELGEDCSTCGSYTSEFRKNKPYGCQWCTGPGKQCHHNSSGCVRQTCPPPSIDTVTPPSTHIRGGTVITINGKELGRGPTDVEYVYLANDVNCTLIPLGFLASKQLTCTSPKTTARSGPVRVKVNNIEESPDHPSFFFGDPKITAINPTKGPQSGGTLLTLSGNDLHIEGLSVLVGTESCDVVPLSTGEELVCKTSPVERINIRRSVSIKLGKEEFPAPTSLIYQYTLDPILGSLAPNKSFESGGRELNITGTYLDSIQTPTVFVRNGAMCSYEETCRHSEENNSSMIHCPSPSILNMTTCNSLEYTKTRRKRQTNSGGYRVSFVMDGVQSVRLPKFSIQYVQDPEYFNFTEEEEFKKGGYLTITGSNLTLAATKWDVLVYVCNASCMVTSLKPDKLECRMPDFDLEGCLTAGLDVVPEGGNKMAVAVVVGNLHFQVGSLIKIVEVEVIDIKVIIIAVCVIFILIIVIVSLLVRMKVVHKRQREERARLQSQYEMLERKVRNEARIEFAELQQDIKLVTGDLISAGVPYKGLHPYTFAMLFPTDIMAENSLLRDSQPSRSEDSNLQDCMKVLDSMISNKFFLLTTLRTLETQKRMTSRDKSNLANVLTVILLNKLGYMMEIWKELLVEHVSKLVDKKLQRQLMRRNETIVEKLLSNWLSLCMYDNMRTHTGSSLFILYKATEMLTEYGPVDAVTGEAHYTLSEERLLKETVETNPLIIQVTVNGEAYPCKVLDCDTVNQAKQKFLGFIYKSTPASQRPQKDDVDLEWQWGQNGRLTLTDFDNTTERDGDWRRVNTLKHYNVMSDANMALLSKEDDEGIELDCLYASSPKLPGTETEVMGLTANLGAVATSSSSLTPVITVAEDIHVDMDTKVWHLVKKEDEEEERKQRVIPEIYLTRLMSTKVPLQSFMDNFMETLFNVSHIPKAVKFLFDLYDELAEENGLDDTDASHTWKSNSLPIRYWANLLRYPHFAFDITKPDVAEPSLDVLSQCFIDSCSLAEIKMGKDSPPSKLLFSKNMPGYRETVRNFYNDVADLTAATPLEVTEEVTNLSMKLQQDNIFSANAALLEFYKTVKNYDEDIISALEDNPNAKNLKLGHKLEELMEKMDNTN